MEAVLDEPMVNVHGKPKPKALIPTHLQGRTRKWRVLVGCHIQPDGPIVRDSDGNWVRQDVMYGNVSIEGMEGTAPNGDVFETNVDMGRYNKPGAQKFQLVEDAIPETEAALERRIDEDRRKLEALRAEKASGKTVTESRPIPDGKGPTPDKLAALGINPGGKPTSEQAQASVDRLVNMMRTYDSMSIDELKRHAEAEEIDLGTARSKAEIIDALMAAE